MAGGHGGEGRSRLGHGREAGYHALYLCLEDSTLRIQNRLFEITEDAPANVHFSTNSDTLGKGLEEQLCAFLSEHPDTVLSPAKEMVWTVNGF